MNVVVFGGAGFLGSHVADSLAEAGYEVTVFDKRPYVCSGIAAVTGDILDETAVRKVIEGTDAVYNFAGLADMDDAAGRPAETVRLNVLGNCNIMDACVEYKVGRFVYASTVYVHSAKGGFYRCSKQASEFYIEEYKRYYDLPFTILRYGSLYGLRADMTNGIYRFIKEAMTKGTITYNGTGEELREYINVKDAADLSAKILAKEYKNKHIIVTGAVPYKVSDMLKTIRDILDRPVEFNYTGGDGLHYNMTPYVYKPQYSYKLTSNYYRDIGQGIFEIISQIGGDLIREENG